MLLEAGLRVSITIKHLEAFVQVADLGAFNRAADRLGTTQPNISARIATLESMLGVGLMHRDPGSVRLTAEGQDLLAHARRVLSALEDFKIASGNAALMDGVLRLGVTEMIAHTWLGDFLTRARELFPKVAVELSVDLSINIETQLAQRSLDLAFHNAPFAHSIDASVDLGAWPLIWVAAPDLVPSDCPSFAVGALASQTIITHSRGARLHDEIAAHFASVGHPSQGLVSSSNLAVCVHMAKAGFGIAAVPEPMAGTYLMDGTLVYVPYAWVPEPLQFAARFEEARAPRYIRAVAELGADVANAFRHS